MAKIDRHISDLLYDHDCVIVPEMGGFLGSYSPASIHPVQHTFSPPSKKIAFNVFLKHNDGLLADYIVQRESLSYNEALKEIRDYVQQYYHELENGQKFIIEKVGMLHMDAERHIQFDPFRNINYLRASFGFSAIQCLPVSSEQVKPKKEFLKAQPRQIRISPKPFTKTKKVNTMNALLLIGSILWLGLNVYFVSPDKMSFASLNPFADTISHVHPPQSTPTTIKPPAPAPVHIENAEVKPATPLNREPAELKHDSDNASSNAFMKENESEIAKDSFFLIAGAFRSMQNAAKMAADLKSKGFAGTTIIENKNGFKMVSYSGYKNQAEAFAALHQLKEKEMGAWVYSAK